MRVVISVVAAVALAACATTGAPVAQLTSGGDVARTLVAPAAPAVRGATYRAIALDELVPEAPARSRTVASTNAPVELWRGTYVGRNYAQRGALALVLRPTADGRVAGVVAWRVARSSVNATAGESVELVRVPVAAAERDGDRLLLKLDEYFDPACNCTARATFSGAVRGDTLSGRFSVDGVATTVVGEERGRWRAVRAPR